MTDSASLAPAAANVDSRRTDYQELKSRIHQALLDRLDLDRLAYVKRDDAEPEIRTPHRGDARSRDRDDAAQPVRARERSRPTSSTSCSGSARSKRCCDDPAHFGHPGQPLRSGLHRAQWPARADRRRLQGRSSPAAHHRAHRQRRRTPHRRVEPDGRRPARRRLARQRGHPADRARRTGGVDSPLPHRAARRAGPGRARAR